MYWGGETSGQWGGGLQSTSMQEGWVKTAKTSGGGTVFINEMWWALVLSSFMVEKNQFEEAGEHD